MWLQDFLPERFPNVRIMIYGYDSSLSESSGKNLLDYRRNFKECLQNARRNCQVRISSDATIARLEGVNLDAIFSGCNRTLFPKFLYL
jgi:hypothetical protein